MRSKGGKTAEERESKTRFASAERLKGSAGGEAGWKVNQFCSIVGAKVEGGAKICRPFYSHKQKMGRSGDERLHNVADNQKISIQKVSLHRCTRAASVTW